MYFIVLLVLAQSCLLQLTHGQIINPCNAGQTDDMFFEFPGIENQFIQCDNNGKPHVQTCPFPLQWRDEFKRCDKASIRVLEKIHQKSKETIIRNRLADIQSNVNTFQTEQNLQLVRGPVNPPQTILGNGFNIGVLIPDDSDSVFSQSNKQRPMSRQSSVSVNTDQSSFETFRPLDTSSQPFFRPFEVSDLADTDFSMESDNTVPLSMNTASMQQQTMRLSSGKMQTTGNLRQSNTGNSGSFMNSVQQASMPASSGLNSGLQMPTSDSVMDNDLTMQESFQRPVMENDAIPLPINTQRTNQMQSRIASSNARVNTGSNRPIDRTKQSNLPVPRPSSVAGEIDQMKVDNSMPINSLQRPAFPVVGNQNPSGSSGFMTISSLLSESSELPLLRPQNIGSLMPNTNTNIQPVISDQQPEDLPVNTPSPTRSPVPNTKGIHPGAVNAVNSLKTSSNQRKPNTGTNARIPPRPKPNVARIDLDLQQIVPTVEPCNLISISGSKMALVNGVYSKFTTADSTLSLYRRIGSRPSLIVGLPTTWCLTMSFTKSDIAGLALHDIQSDCANNECCLLVSNRNNGQLLTDSSRVWTFNMLSDRGRRDANVKFVCSDSVAPNGMKRVDENTDVLTENTDNIVDVRPPAPIQPQVNIQQQLNSNLAPLPSQQVQQQQQQQLNSNLAPLPSQQIQQQQQPDFRPVLTNVPDFQTEQGTQVLVDTCDMVRCPGELECLTKVGCNGCNPICNPKNNQLLSKVVNIKCSMVTCPQGLKCQLTTDKLLVCA